MYDSSKDRENGKIEDKFNKLIKIVLTPYRINRHMQNYVIENSGLSDKESQLFEMGYLLGVVDAVSQVADSNAVFLTPQVGLKLAKPRLVELDLISESLVDGVSSIAILISYHDVMVNLQNKGGAATMNCLRYLGTSEFSAKAFVAMSLDYFEDDCLVAEFKKLFKDKLT
jgi:hypothetical protein